MRISVTQLDGFQYFLNSDLSEADYIQRLSTFEDNRPMKIGRGFESIITSEPNQYDKFGHYEIDGIKYSNQLIQKGFDRLKDLNAVKQVKIVSEVAGVNLVGVADLLYGNIIADIKTTANYSFAKYYDSWQWKAYLTLFELDIFKYFVFEINDSDIVELKEFHLVNCFRYALMESELNVLVSEFKDFIQIKNLQHIFKDK